MSHAFDEYGHRRFTAEEVLRMVEVGILGEDEPLELIEGELVMVPPQGPEHLGLKDRLRRRLERIYGDDAYARDQGPLDCGADSLPEPDLAFARGTPDDFLHRHATGADCELVVEIALTSQRLDRRKAAVYARGGAPVYWLVDVAARRVEVHTGPTENGYRVVTILADSEAVDVPGTATRLRVADLLP